MKSAKESREQFIEKKERIERLLDQTIETFRLDDHKEAVKVVEKLKESFEKEEYTIIVVGEFSAGKSTLLNALMGRRILTSFTSETTATVNFLRHKSVASEGEEGRVYYNDGREKILEKVDKGIIDQYVSTKGENVAENIRKLDLYLDSDFLKDGVSIVDSPGLNGIKEGHREITEEQIKKSHACIFLFTNEHPGSRSEFEFIKELREKMKVKNIFFVLNKIDVIKPEEGETVEMVMENLRDSFKKEFPDTESLPEVWPLSARDALNARDPSEQGIARDKLLQLEGKSRIQDFESRLMQFLTCGQKTRDIFMVPIDRIRGLAEEIKDTYDQERAVLEGRTDTEEIKKQIEELQQKIDEEEGRGKSHKRELKRAVGKINKELASGLEEEIENIVNEIIENLKHYEDTTELKAYANSSLEKEFFKKIGRAEERCYESFFEKIQDVVDEEIEDALNEANLENSSVKMRRDQRDRRVFGEHLQKVGLDGMDRRKEERRRELEELRKQQESLEKDYIAAENIEKKKEKSEKEIEKYKEKIDKIKNSSLPKNQYYFEDEEIEVARGGVFGVVANFLVGKKTKTVQVRKVDDSERKEEEARRDKEIEETMKLKEAEEKERNQYLQSCRSFDEIKCEKKQVDEKIIGKEVADKVERESDIKRIEEIEKKNLKKLKREVTKWCEDQGDELKGEALKRRKESEKAITELVVANIEEEVRRAILKEKDKMEGLLEVQKNAENGLREKLQLLEEKENRLSAIYNEAVDLGNELEMESVDVLEEVSL